MLAAIEWQTTTAATTKILQTKHTRILQEFYAIHTHAHGMSSGSKNWGMQIISMQSNK